MRFRPATVLIVVLFAVSKWPPVSVCQEQPVRVAIAGLSSNVESFDHYKCRYRVTRALTDTVEAARQRKWVDAVSCEFKIVVNDDLELFECYAPPIEVMNPKAAKDKKTVVVSVPFGKGSQLKHGPVQLYFSANLETASLNKAEWGREISYNGITPLDMGILGYRFAGGPAARLAKTDRYSFVAEPDRRIGGNNTHVATFRLKGEKDEYGFRRFFLDPDQGYLPLRYEAYYKPEEEAKGAPKVVAELLAARECSGGRWFPDRVLHIAVTDLGDKKYQVTEIQVLELDADYKAPIDEFTIEMPAGTYIKAAKSGTEYGDSFFRLKQKERVDVRDIPAMFDMLKKVPRTPLADTTIPHHPTRSWWHWPAIAGGVVVVLLGGWYVYRRRRLRTLAGVGSTQGS